MARTYLDGQPEEKWVVAVPTDPCAPAVILATDAASSTMGMGNLVWQRRLADAAMPAPTTVPN